MKIVILGAGGLGSVIGAHLVRAGEEVTFITRGQRATFLQHHGIILTGLANFSVPVTVATQPQDVREADVLIVTVKTYDTEAALASVGHLAVDSVLSLQNGVLKNEQLAGYFVWEKVLGAATFTNAEVLPDGSVRFMFNGELTVGELPTGTSERVQTLATTLTHAGIPAEASPQVQTAEWSKYVWWVGGGAAAVLMRTEAYKYLKDPDGALIVARLMLETAQLAAKLGIPLEDRGPLPVKTICSVSLDEAVATLQRFGVVLEARAPTAKASILQDLERGRPLEVEETLGYAVRKGVELGIPLPTVETCYRLIAGVAKVTKTVL